MAGNIYKTSQGKELDLGKLMLKNEETRAVGNMKVNARGDSIDSDNKNVQDRNKQVSKNYRKQIGTQVKDMPVMDSKKSAKLVAEKYVRSEVQITGLDDAPTAPKDLFDATEAELNAGYTDTPIAAPEAKGGLAEAIAKAREVKQEPVKTPHEEARSVDGVKKI